MSKLSGHFIISVPVTHGCKKTVSIVKVFFLNAFVKKVCTECRNKSGEVHRSKYI